MSKGIACQCSKGIPRKERMKNWRIIDYKCNYSKFNGCRYTPSDWSKIRCLCCGNYWRTKQSYVDDLDFATDEEQKRIV